MTTGPSSGHSESWYWLQSSHPANRHQTVRGDHAGREAPKEVARLHAWETQTPHPRGEANGAPHRYETEQTRDVLPHPEVKTQLYGNFKACRVTSMVTNEIVPRNDSK